MEWNKWANSIENQVFRMEINPRTQPQIFSLNRQFFYSAQAVLNGDVDPLEVDNEEFEGEEATEDPEDGDGAIRDEL